MASYSDCMGVGVETLFVMDPLDRIDVAGDSTYMQMLEGCRRGHRVSWCTPGDLYALDGASWANCHSVQVQEQAPHFQSEPSVDRCLGDFDVIWLRKDPPFHMGYVFSTYLLDLVPPRTLVLNDPAAIRNANEKMIALKWPQFCPPSLVTREISRAMAWIAEVPGRVVLKPWDGNGGRGVVVSQSGDGNLRAMLELLTDEERVHIVIQHFIDEIAKGDKRIILIDGKAVGSMNRVPQPGDHRGNMHVGASVESSELTPRDREICEEIGPWLKEQGLLFVGIDVIGQFMTEINVTSPTGIQEINALMGTRLESDLEDAVQRCLVAHREEGRS